MKKIGLVLLLMGVSLGVWAQADRHEVRAGNRKFRKEAFKEAEIDYRKAVLKDTTSVAAQYDLASALYRQDDFESAAKALEAVKEIAPATPHAADYFFNAGDVALQKKDYAAAVEAFKQSLLRRPEDLDAKENYLYAKKMLDDQQQNGGGGQNNQDQNQDQNQSQDQNQDQNQNQDQQNPDPSDQNQEQGGQQPQESKISPQQAQQMIQAIQAKEKETQDKVNKKKAALLQSRQREKNW